MILNNVNLKTSFFTNSAKGAYIDFSENRTKSTFGRKCYIGSTNGVSDRLIHVLKNSQLFIFEERKQVLLHINRPFLTYQYKGKIFEKDS